jgi:hypothetical protein
VQTGFLNGSSDKEQQLNGNLVKGVKIASFLPPHSLEIFIFK